MPFISNCSEQIEVGDLVTTNGDGANRVIPNYIFGVVGKVGKKYFHLYHDDPNYQGESENAYPAEFGKRYSWCIGLKNPIAMIVKKGTTPTPNGLSEMVGAPLITSKICISLNKKPKSMLNRLSAALSRLLDANTKSQIQAGFRHDDLSLTACGMNELLELIAVDYADKLSARAAEVIAECEKNKSSCS